MRKPFSVFRFADESAQIEALSRLEGALAGGASLPLVGHAVALQGEFPHGCNKCGALHMAGKVHSFQDCPGGSVSFKDLQALVGTVFFVERGVARPGIERLFTPGSSPIGVSGGR